MLRTPIGRWPLPVVLALLASQAARGEESTPPDPRPSSIDGAETQQEPGWLEVGLGFDVLHRRYRYQGLALGAELREYSFPLFVSPRLHLGLFPLSTPNGFVRQVGLELDGAVGLSPTVRRPGDETDYSSALYQLDAGIRVRLRLGPTVVLSPVVGYSRSHARVQPSNSGASLSGIPNLDVGAIRTGASLEGPIHGPLGFTLEATYLWVLSAGQLFESPYFPDGRGGFSFESSLGLSLRLGAELALRLQGDFSQLGFVLNDPRATGATAQSFGGGLSLRYTGVK